MLTIIHATSDAALAKRLQADLQEVEGIDASHVTIVILSPDALADRSVEQAMTRALDAGQHLIPVLARPAALPKLIDHLTPLDFSSGYDRDALIFHVTALSRPDAALPLKVRTPAVRAANRRTGYVMALIAFIMFLVGLYMVGVLGVQAPAEEFATVSGTETAEIRAIMERYLPRGTQDALGFPSTLIAVTPARLQPLLSEAATATARGD